MAMSGRPSPLKSAIDGVSRVAPCWENDLALERAVTIAVEDRERIGESVRDHQVESGRFPPDRPT